MFLSIGGGNMVVVYDSEVIFLKVRKNEEKQDLILELQVEYPDLFYAIPSEDLYIEFQEAPLYMSTSSILLPSKVGGKYTSSFSHPVDISNPKYLSEAISAYMEICIQFENYIKRVEKR